MKLWSPVVTVGCYVKLFVPGSDGSSRESPDLVSHYSRRFSGHWSFVSVLSHEAVEPQKVFVVWALQKGNPHVCVSISGCFTSCLNLVSSEFLASDEWPKCCSKGLSICRPAVVLTVASLLSSVYHSIFVHKTFWKWKRGKHLKSGFVRHILSHLVVIVYSHSLTVRCLSMS